MIHTEFLLPKHYGDYRTWLKDQDKETLDLYFGVAAGDHVIDALMDSIIGNSDDHHILVAKDGNNWVGTIHIAVGGKTVEFGVIVDAEYRGKGIAGDMLEEAITWARNRGYGELFMHCLSWNKPIRHLCEKHGLQPRNVYGDSEVQIKLNPPNWVTLNKEFCIRQRNLFHMFLDGNKFLYKEIYG
jgi:RimJ/RimL family protein N-acetyltransferase